MNNKPNKFWCNWLAVVSISIALSSLLTIVSPKLVHVFFNYIAFFGKPPNLIVDPLVAEYLSFVYGVLGSVMIGWNVIIYLIVTGPFQRGERWAWNAIAASVTLWFLIDTLHSLTTGFWGNALFNVSVLTLFLIPLVGTFRDFQPEADKR